MTSNNPPARPPRATAWLVELFASPQEADGILGDLAEEFSASHARDGGQAARRGYRRQAWRTIGDLVASPWQTRLRSRDGAPMSGFMLTAGIGLAGLAMTAWPLAMITNWAARGIVTHYPVYDYLPASVFWEAINLLPSLLGGFVIALIARSVRFRPMSAALAVITAIAVLFAVDRPIVMLLYGPPLNVNVTIASSIVRWVRGILTFGTLVMIGAAIGRGASLRGDSRSRPQMAVRK